MAFDVIVYIPLLRGRQSPPLVRHDVVSKPGDSQDGKDDQIIKKKKKKMQKCLSFLYINADNVKWTSPLYISRMPFLSQDLLIDGTINFLQAEVKNNHSLLSSCSKPFHFKIRPFPAKEQIIFFTKQTKAHSGNPVTCICAQM